jgi:hypothetical protein
VLALVSPILTASQQLTDSSNTTPVDSSNTTPVPPVRALW